MPLHLEKTDEPGPAVSSNKAAPTLLPPETTPAPNQPSVEAMARLVADEPLGEPDDADAPVPEKVIPPADLWHGIRTGMQLDHTLAEKRVGQELAWYARHPRYLDRVATRSSPYLYYIVQEVKKRGMPMEIALLPIVESAFDPFAYSHGRASGLWQFIPSTARLYGLKIDWWYDGRRDVVASTHAALDYLQALHKTFDGDWLLALAAYNSGQGNVRKSIRRNERLGKPTDFWSLKLLRETSAYVPRLLAISSLVMSPEAHDIKLKSLPDEPYFEIVSISGQLDLARAAELADMDTEALYLLNPAFNRWSTHPEGPHRLLVPVSKAEDFALRLAAMPPEQKVAWLRHKIRSGESLGRLATRYNTTIDVIRQVNGIKGNSIRAGDTLMIPSATATAEDYALSAGQRDGQRENRLSSKYGDNPLKYQVRSGDSLWTISRAHDVSFRNLASWNGMAPTDPLMPGRELLIWSRQLAGNMEQIQLPANGPEIIRKVTYRVRSGESLSHIAAKFRISVGDIQRWNSDLKGKRYIHPGDRLVLHIDVTNGS